MADYISREAAIEALRPYKVDPFKIGFLDDTIDAFNDGIDTAISCISVEVPAADVRPVVRGHYVGEYDGYADGSPVYDMWYCSECGCCFEDWDEKPTYNFCPNCGADMREETK